MTQLSLHFSAEELTASESADRLGINNTPPISIVSTLIDTAQQMERVRDVLGQLPIHVNSGYRSVELNRAIGGVPTSAHCRGYAVDFVCPQYGTPLAVATSIASSGIRFDQLILEYGWVHISFDPQMRGQILTKKSAAAPYENGLHG